ncbi:MAG: hypothetical protein M1840_007389 [Geoglossum simile]|nr:MAG: hypothetical protein M1840_007389 [Geoglossum simile]
MTTEVSKRRFAEIRADTESPESPGCYGPQGFHPTQLGQVLDRRYHVLRKLDHEPYATTWLAKDIGKDRYVALKVFSSTEVKRGLHEFLFPYNEAKGSRHPGKEYLLKRLHCCRDGSPDKAHIIVVTEPIGQTLEEHLSLHLRESGHVPRNGFVRKVSRQVVLGLGFAHYEGVTNRGADSHFIPKMYDQIMLDSSRLPVDLSPGKIFFEVQGLDGEPLDSNSPPYLVERRPLDDGVSITTLPSKFRVLIGGFGSSLTLRDVNDGGQAPFLRHDLQNSSLACRYQEDKPILGVSDIFHIATLRPLFTLDPFNDEEKRNDEHLQRITEILGPLPPDMLSHWRNRRDFVDENGNLLESVVSKGISKPLEELIRTEKPVDMDRKEEDLFTSFLRSMLQLEPSKRMLAKKLQKHLWLAGRTFLGIKLPR